MAKCIDIWWNEYSRKKGWVTMKIKCANDNECGADMSWGLCKRWEQSQMSLSKCYQNVLTYESVKLMKRPHYEHSNESIEINTLNTNDEMRNHLLSYDVLILEVNLHDVRVECNGTLYWAPID